MRRVPQFEDAFKETLVQYPAAIPDRRYTELYESPELNFIGRPFEDMARFHEGTLSSEGIQNFLKMEAQNTGTHIHTLVDKLNQIQQGYNGSVGPAGPQGAPGEKGEKGEKGDERPTATPSRVARVRDLTHTWHLKQASSFTINIFVMQP